MCEVKVVDDEVVFTAPELELVMGYFSTKPIAEKVEYREGSLRISPAHLEVVQTLEHMCKSDVSALLLDIKESLLHLGWLVEGSRDVVKIRKSRRKGVSGFLTVEYDKSERKISIVTTERCLEQALENLGFKVVKTKYLLEAAKQPATLIETLEVEEKLTQEVCG